MKLTPAQTEELRCLLARCADSPMTQAELDRLNELLAADTQAQQMFADYAMLDACLEMVWTAGEERVFDDLTTVESEYSDEPLHILQSSPALHLPLSPFYSPAGSFLFSYGAAAVIVATGLLIGWACHVPTPRSGGQVEVVRETTQPPVSPVKLKSDVVFVGRITGMVDCQWSDARTTPNGFDRIARGQEFRLAAGLVEIQYDTGAKVILQGPCVYEVDSRAGGYLSFGKVTARVEKKTNDERPTPEASQELDSAVSSPALFVVRTPTATITDLGTEFGVEVDKSGVSKAHVYQGTVELRVDVANAKSNQVVALNANESGRVDAAKGRIAVVRETNEKSPFLRQMPKRVRINVFNTGVNLKDGDPDPHWQVVARSDDPKFKAKPAVVAGVDNGMRLSNQADRSQWISLVGSDVMLPENVVYTFRTTFDLKRTRPATAVLFGRFIVDNHIRAIRLNGRDIRVVTHQYEEFHFFHSFSVGAGFIDGVNTLEFEVENGAPEDPSPASPMGLLVEFEGSVLSAWQDSSPKAVNTNQVKDKN
jgi:hypothetical protein